MRIQKVTRKHLLRACREYLSANPVNNLLLLGDLCLSLFEVSEVCAAIEKGKVSGVSSVFHAFSLPSTAIGTANRRIKTALLEKALGTISTDFITLDTADETCLYENYATILHSYSEHQMILTRSESVEANSDITAQKAPKKNLETLHMFYVETESAAWNPIQFKTGPYYIVKRKNKIVSAAGIHILTPQIAQLGNVLTDKAYRQKGYSKVCTSALVIELSSNNRIISLFVRTDNAPAIHMYERIGFQKAKTINFLIMRKKPYQPRNDLLTGETSEHGSKR